MLSRLKAGLDLDAWMDDTGGDPQMLGDSRAAANGHEVAYSMQTPSVTYPLFENALRGKYGLSLDQHRKKLGDLYQRFNAVAAQNPLSWFPSKRSAEEIATASVSNRYVGFPYTKFLNSIIQVNMGAAVILTSVAKARELGVADDRMVYLHGCADANDIWNVSERVDYSSSPAIRTIGQKALAMAEKTVDQMDYFDIYSCFPSAVQIACDELGIAHDDDRGLTVTGGLPYFGGPGTDYVTHSIATMMDVPYATIGIWLLDVKDGSLPSIPSASIPPLRLRAPGHESVQKIISRQFWTSRIAPSPKRPVAKQRLKPIPCCMAAQV